MLKTQSQGITFQSNRDPLSRKRERERESEISRPAVRKAENIFVSGIGENCKDE